MNPKKEKNFEVELDEEGYVLSITTMMGSLDIELPNPEFQNCYKYIDNEFIIDEDKYQQKLAEKNKALEKDKAYKEIFILKNKLTNSDYKIIKCYEAQLAGEILPYDIIELHRERNTIRDKINEIENLIK